MGDVIKISDSLSIAESEVEFSAIRAQGAGGQHVNKASTAAHLRFDIAASSLPDAVKTRLLALRDRRVSGEGVIVIKAQESRSLESNRREALERLCELIRSAAARRKPRRPTKPTRGSIRRRLDEKNRRGETKAMRKKPPL